MVVASRKPLRRHSIVMSAAAAGTQAIPGVGATVAIGAPSRLKVQTAPGGAVSTKISARSGRDTQPAIARQQMVKDIGRLRIGATCPIVTGAASAGVA